MQSEHVAAPAYAGKRFTEEGRIVAGPADKSIERTSQRKSKKKKKNKRKKGKYSDATPSSASLQSSPLRSPELPASSTDSLSKETPINLTETEAGGNRNDQGQVKKDSQRWDSQVHLCTKHAEKTTTTAAIDGQGGTRASCDDSQSVDIDAPPSMSGASQSSNGGEEMIIASTREKGLLGVTEVADTEERAGQPDHDDESAALVDEHEEDVDDEETRLLPSDTVCTAAAHEADAGMIMGGVSTVGDSGTVPDPCSPPAPHRGAGNREAEGNRSIASRPPSVWSAVRRSDAVEVRTRLAAGAAVDEADDEGDDLFAQPLDLYGSNGRTPLMVACATGDVPMAKLLLKEISPPASVAARTIEGWTPLMVACGGGKLGVAKLLIEAGAALRDKDSVFESDPLMWACGGGHAGVVRYLLDHGAAGLLDSVNKEMCTPLSIACDAGSLETVQMLVEAGADMNMYNIEGRTAIDIAASRNHLLVECYLRGEGARSSAEFWDAVDEGNVTTVSRLLKANGHLINAVDMHGRTALLLACVGLHLDLARILVEAGADVNSRDPTGTSPLSIAVVFGNMELTRYLVQAGGASLSHKNSSGWTPLMQAVAKGDLKMARYLVDRGAAVNEGTTEGDSVLDLARRFSKPELQRYLEAKGGFSSHDVKRQIGVVNDGGRGVFRLW